MIRWRLLLLLTAALLTSACQSPDPELIRLGIAGRPANLDPLHATDAASARVNRLLYRALVDFDAQQRPVPELARWERLTPTRYRFHLDPERAPFHDGAPLTAADVVATYQAVLDPATGSPHRGLLSLIEQVSSVDVDTVEFQLKRADRLFPGYLVIGIVPARLLAQGHDFQRAPIGSGPLELIERGGDGQLRLRRRRDGQQLAVQQVKDPTVRVLKLQRGELDIIQNDLPAELIRYLDGREEIRIERHRGSNFSYIGFNLEDAQTGDPRLRRAVAHAIDRRAIIAHLLAGAARPAGALLPPGHWAGHPELDGVDYDPDRARALLSELGYGPQRPLELSYKTSSDPLRLRIATVFQDQLARVGIRLRLQSYDWGTFYGDIKAGRFQLYSLMWVGIKTPDIFRHVFHSASLPPGGANRGRYRDARIDAWIEAAEAAQTQTAQVTYYRRIQARLLETLPYVPLWYEDHVYAARADIHGYRLNLHGNYDGLLEVQRR